ALRARASVLLVATTEYHEDVERQAIKALQDRRVDGMLYAAMYHRVVALPAVLVGSPVVVVNARTQDADTSWVGPGEGRGGAVARLPARFCARAGRAVPARTQPPRCAVIHRASVASPPPGGGDDACHRPRVGARGAGSLSGPISDNGGKRGSPKHPSPHGGQS